MLFDYFSECGARYKSAAGLIYHRAYVHNQPASRTTDKCKFFFQKIKRLFYLDFYMTRFICLNIVEIEKISRNSVGTDRSYHIVILSHIVVFFYFFGYLVGSC